MQSKPSTTLQPGQSLPAWLKDYKKRLGNKSQIAAVQMDIVQIDSSKVTDTQTAILNTHVVSEFATAIGAKPSAIVDLNGNPGNVSNSHMDHLVTDCRITVPPGKCVKDIVAALKNISTKQQIVNHIAAIPGIQDAISGPLSPSNIVVSVGESSKDGFFDLDTNFDGYLNKDEFITAAKIILKPATTKDQASIDFEGLDTNHDGKLDSDEFFACHIKDLLKEEGPPSPLSLFVQRLRAAYLTFEERFSALDGDNDGNSDYAEFTSGTQIFDPPLTPEQCEKAFKELDVNHDHVLTRAELRNALKDKRHQTYSEETY